MNQRDSDILRRSDELRRKELERTRALLELYKKASRLVDREIYEHALDLAVGLTDSRIGYIHQVDDDQTTLSLTTWNKEALKACTAPHDTHYPLSQAGIWADCVRFRP